MSSPNGKERITNWDQVPILLTVQDIQQKFGLAKHQSYAIAHQIGRVLGKKLVVPKERLRQFLEG